METGEPGGFVKQGDGEETFLYYSGNGDCDTATGFQHQGVPGCYIRAWDIYGHPMKDWMGCPRLLGAHFG
jgi:hypothetical protein